MGFGRELKDFSAGFEVGHRAGMNRRSQKLNEYRYGKPPDSEVAGTDTPLDEPGSGAIPTTKTDPVETGATEQPATAQSGVNDVDTQEIAGRLKYDLARDFKLNDTATTGIVASLAAESGGFKMLQELKPMKEGSRGGWGYAQWTGPRRKQFEQFAADNKLDPKSYEANYGFLKQELSGPEGRWLQGLNEAKDARQATQMFTGSAAEKRGFLRPGLPNMQGRFNWADRIAKIEPLDFGSPATKPKDAFDKIKAGGEALSEGFEDAAPAEEPEDDNVETAEAIPVPEAETGDLSDWTEFASLDAGGLSPPRDQESRPAMFAEAGGVIPEPTAMFAGGGTTNPEIIKARQLGLAGGSWAPTVKPTAGTPAAVGGPSTFTPRRVGQPASGVQGYEPMKMVNGLTPTQVELKKSRDTRDARDAAAAKAASDAAAKAKADADAAAAAKAKAGIPSFEDWKNYTLTGRQPGQIGSMSGGFANPKLMKMAQTPEGQAELQKQYNLMYGGDWQSDAAKKERIKWQARNMMFGTGLHVEQGGVIPEPETINYARGGPVEDRDATFKRLLREETRVGSHDAQGARDRAARRLSAMEGRPSSTAYSPSDDGYFTKRPKKAGPGKAAPTPTPRPSNEDPVETGAIPTPSTHTYEHERDTSLQPSAHDTEHERDTSLDNDNEVRVPLAEGPEGIPPELQPGAAAPAPSPAPAIPEPDEPPVERPAEGGGVTRRQKSALEIMKEEEGRRAAAAGRASDAKRAIIQAHPGAKFNTPPVDTGPAMPAPNAMATPALEPSHAAAISIAKQALEQGENPQEVGQALRDAGVPIDALPPEIQSKILGFQEGGVIPEDVGWSFAAGGAVPEQGERGYNEAVAQGLTARQPVEAEPEQEDLQATPKLMGDVAVALDGGVKYLTRAFGIGGDDGGIPTPEAGADREQGIKRLASGEGAATQEELAGIDDKIDPDRRMREGDRNMVRIAKTVQWYLQNGRKDDAEAAAASLMQYGAQRFGKLGSLAGAAYTAYQNGGDPKDLQNTIKFLEKAYEMIPDGANINVQLDEMTGKLMTTHTDHNGEETVHEVDPAELPGLLQQVQSGSAYWNSIYKLADPEGYRSDLTEKRELAREGRTDAREEKKNAREAEEEAGRDKRESEQEAARNEREKKEAEELRKRIKAETDAEKKATLERELAEKQQKEVDWDKVNPLLNEVADAKRALDNKDLSEEEQITAQEAYNRTLSRLQDALPQKMNRAEWIKQNTGLDRSEWDYLAPEKEAPELPPLPPEVKQKFPNARPGKDRDGNPAWFFTGSDGKPRQVPMS